jgi:hypothetical protein
MAMATKSAITALPEIPRYLSLRIELEELLFDFYSVVGIAPRRGYPLNAADLLADDFQGRFFIKATSELLCFDKQGMLKTKVSGSAQRPGSQLVSMNMAHDDDGSVSVSYVAAFGHGQTATVRRGALKAVETASGWRLRSLDEDVRVILLPEPRKYLHSAPDQPRVWIR